jgi:hypothetical protein
VLRSGEHPVPGTALEALADQNVPVAVEDKAPLSSKWRRSEGLLRLGFNEGREGPAEWLAEAVLEAVEHFGTASYETQQAEGQ